MVFDLSRAYTTNVDDLSASIDRARAVRFSDDGAKMFVLNERLSWGVSPHDWVFEFSLSTPRDITSTVTLVTSINTNSTASDPYGMSFANNGAELYIHSDNSNNVRRYSLSTPYDLTTAVSWWVGATSGNSHWIFMKNDGTSIYKIQDASPFRSVIQFNLGTAYNISSASNVATFDITPQTSGGCWGISFSPDWFRMYVSDISTDVIYQYNLTTARDITTASYSNISFDYSAEWWTAAQWLYIEHNLGKCFVSGNTSDTIGEIFGWVNLRNLYKLDSLTGTQPEDFVWADDGTNTNIVLTAGKQNSAYNFNINTSEAARTWNTLWWSDTQPTTISMLVKPTDIGSWFTTKPIFVSQNSADWTYVTIGINNSGDVLYGKAREGTTTPASFAAWLQNDIWYHIVVTVRAWVSTLFIDWLQVATNTDTWTGAGLSDNSTLWWNSLTSYTGEFIGVVDDLIIRDNVLESSAIKTLYARYEGVF